MSDPARKATNPARSTGRRDQPGWFVVSIVLHLAAAVALIFFTPIREVFLQDGAVGQASTRPRMSTRQITEVANKLDEITEDHIERNVRAMHDMLQQMQEVNDEEFAEYVVFEHSQIERTPEYVNDSLEQALAAMQQAVDLIEADDHTRAITQQAVAMSHQESIEQRLELVQASPQVREAQQQAATVQKQAATENERAAAATSQVQQLEQRLKYHEGTIPTLEARVPQFQEAIKATEEKLADNRAKLEEARQKLDRPTPLRMRMRLSGPRIRSVGRDEQAIEKKQADLATHQERLQQTTSEVTELRQSKDQQQRIADTAHQAARQQQAEAIQLQTDVAEKIRQDVAERVAALKAELAPDQTVQEVLSPTTEVPQTDEMNALDLYEAARAAERRLAEKYRQGRAMRLAMVQDATFSASLDAIDRVAPVRPELPAKALTGEAHNEEQLDAKKQAVHAALAGTSSMVALGNALLTQAIMSRYDVGMGGGAGRISLAAIRARSAQTQQLETLASQAVSGKAVDLAQAMRAGSTPEGNNDDEKGPVDTGTERRPYNTGEALPPIDKSIRPVAGRKVSDDGEGAQWMAVTPWYMLGPFANPGRANIDRVFPPESFIDLSALYVGKDNRSIEWTFTHTDHEQGRLIPTNDEPYGIWYAFTELHFDRARDLWITMGSDDKGRLWINDSLVWVSESHHKIWEPDEAQRRVHFRKGRNKILFRIENGQHGMVFSLWVRLPEG